MVTRRPPSYVLLAGVGLYMLALFASAEATDIPSTPTRRGPISVQDALRILRERRKQQFLRSSGETGSMTTTFKVTQDPRTATMRTVTRDEPRNNPELNEIRFIDLISTMTPLKTPRKAQPGVMENMFRPLPKPSTSESNASEVALLKQSETTLSEKNGIPFQKASDSNDEDAANGPGSTINDTYLSQDVSGNLTGYHQLEENITVDEVDIIAEISVSSAINSNISLEGYHSNISNIGEHYVEMINTNFTSAMDRIVDSIQNTSVYHVSEEISDMTSDDTDRNNLTSSNQYGLSASDNYTSTYTDRSKSVLLFTEGQNSTASNSTTEEHPKSGVPHSSIDTRQLGPKRVVSNSSTEEPIASVTTSSVGDFITTVTSINCQTTASEPTTVYPTYENTPSAQRPTSESQTFASTEQTTSRPKQTTSGYMYRTTDFDPLTNRGGPFLRKPNAFDFLMMGQIATAQRNEKQREFRESNYEASAQICALLNKRFCRLSIGGRCC